MSPKPVDIKHFPLCPLLVLVQRVTLSYHSWKLTFHTVHFMASSLMPYTSKIHFFPPFSWLNLVWSVWGTGHVANLSQHGRGRKMAVLDFKGSFHEAENKNAYFLQGLPTVELCIKRTWNHSAIWHFLTLFYALATFSNQKSVIIFLRSHFVSIIYSNVHKPIQYTNSHMFCTHRIVN